MHKYCCVAGVTKMEVSGVRKCHSVTARTARVIRSDGIGGCHAHPWSLRGHRPYPPLKCPGYEVALWPREEADGCGDAGS